MRKKHNHPPKQQKSAPSGNVPPVETALLKAIEHHQAGRLVEAETGYQAVLAIAPSQPVALHLLGVVAYQVKQYQVALELIDSALRADPRYADAYANRGIVLHALHRYKEAVESYDRTLELNSKSAEAYSNRSNALHSLKQHQSALDDCDKAVALKPDFPEAWNNRGNALLSLGRQAEALASFDRAIELQPDYADAYSNRGNTLMALDRSSRPEKQETTGRDLVIYCPPMGEMWNPDIARASGIGGSEEAIIWLSRLLHHRGWNVTVYANCGSEEKIYDGVRWRPHWLWNRRDRQNVTILWRWPHVAEEHINSDRVFVDLHDVIPESELSVERVAKLDRIFAKSKFHRSLYPHIDDAKFAIIPNGIDATLFERIEERDPLLLINTSSADRSMEAFLDCFAAIKLEVPAARAEWAYGWGAWFASNIATPERMAWKATIQARMRELGVEERGRLSHTDVASLYLRGNIFAYPCEMAEIDCISLSKAMAGGAIPLTTDFAALGEKAGHGGIFLHSSKTKDDWALPGQFHYEMTDPLQKAQFTEHAIRLLRNPPSEDERESMRQWARATFDWNAIADAWHKILAGPTQHAAALEAYDKAIALNPQLAGAHNNRGIAAFALMDYDAAHASFQRALALDPGNADAHVNSANVLLTQKNYEGALAGYQAGLAANPAFEYLRGMMLFLKRRLCDWSEAESELDELEAALQAGELAAPPFATLALFDSLPLQRKAAETFTRAKFPSRTERPFQSTSPPGHKIRLGYFSSDFYNHATSYLMAELFERHDRSRFEVIGFSFGPSAGDEMSKRVAAAMDRFIDVRTMVDSEVTDLARGLELDIAIDLKGYTRDHRTGIFAGRAAPIQIQYVGYPGTMGADFIDYLIADHTVILDEMRQHYTEKIVRLPNSYQPNDSRRRIAARSPTRAEERLPASGFVFCCFNNAYKIAPRVFDQWMRILTRVEGSVLWLLDESSTTEANLRAEAVRRHVSPERIVFARPLDLPEHLARLRLANLFLDTLPYNAHTTASDALWCGVPVLTRIGESFPARVAASLLHAVGMPELIAETPEDYERVAIDLAQDSARLQGLRDRLVEAHSSSPLFNTSLYTQHLEAAYIAMQGRHEAGLEPDHIDI